LGYPTPINIVSQLAEPSANSSTQDVLKEQPILKLDFSKLIREEVTCGTRQVMAVVDTGAALTVISPELLKESQFVMRPWDGPRVVMANGEQATLMGAATISVNHEMGTATGEAVVFGMDGIDLILGNDFLKQYGKVQIDYREPKASITFGDQPLAAITSQRTNNKTWSVKLISNNDVTIPSFSVANVGTVAPAL
jgi:predicted aspartyl protease